MTERISRIERKDGIDQGGIAWGRMRWIDRSNCKIFITKIM